LHPPHCIAPTANVAPQNQADADYYTDHDPAHIAFKNTLGGLGFAGVTVLDFTPGEF
jgi:hypothetical protein